MQLKAKLLKGAIIGAIVAAVANQITFHNFELKNMLISSALSAIIYLLIHLESEK